MGNNSEKTLTNRSKKPDIDSVWEQIKTQAMDLRYGSVCCRFIIHDGQIKRAELFDPVRQIRPY